ncbi:MAG: hypothetical protein U1E60_16355 [Reyranellaceae bacterium]
MNHHSRLGDVQWGATIVGEWEKYSIGDADFFLSRVLPNGLDEALVGLIAEFRGLELLPTYSSYCYLVASVVVSLLTARGLGVRLFDCCVAMKDHGREFLLGHGIARPGQINGHLACIVDDRVLVDFGLGAARKYSPLRDVPQGVVCRLPASAEEAVSVHLPTGLDIEWRRGAMPPNREHELQVNGRVAAAVIRRWRRRLKRQQTSTRAA